MSRSPNPVLRLIAAALLLAVAPAFGGTVETAPPLQTGRAAGAGYDAILLENDLNAAEAFLSDAAGQRRLELNDGLLYERVFARAAELSDMKGLLMGTANARSIRLGILDRQGCAFCLDAARFTAWARKNMSWLDEAKFPAIARALWSWEALTPAQKDWVKGKKKDAAWSRLTFAQRHELMREWALAERGFLLKVNPGSEKALAGYYARAQAVSDVLGNHELSEVWNRGDEAAQAVASLVEARAKVGKGADKRQQALLAEATSAASPEARLAALAKLFENGGGASRELLAAAPPRDGQRFDDRSRGVVSEMLKTALLRETENTFAGADLKEFYAKTPLTVTFTTTSYAALGWYRHGGDTLYFNERYVEQYIKSRDLSVDAVMKDPELIADLARTLVGTFVHEAQHHRQDVWSREQKMPRNYVQSDEVEAFQVQALFLLEKLKTDRRFADFAAREGGHSDVLKAGLSRARAMEEHGPDWFEYVVPNTHYPEIYSNEGAAWCHILNHNSVAGEIEGELKRRDGLAAAARSALERGPSLAEDYPSRQSFSDGVKRASTASLRTFLETSRRGALDAPKYYNLIRRRREGFAATTGERYESVMKGGGGRTNAEPPPPGGEDR